MVLLAMLAVFCALAAIALRYQAGGSPVENLGTLAIFRKPGKTGTWSGPREGDREIEPAPAGEDGEAQSKQRAFVLVSLV